MPASNPRVAAMLAADKILQRQYGERYMGLVRTFQTVTGYGVEFEVQLGDARKAAYDTLYLITDENDDVIFIDR